MKEDNKQYDFNELMAKIFNLDGVQEDYPLSEKNISEWESYPWHKKENKPLRSTYTPNRGTGNVLFEFKENILTVELAGLCLDDIDATIQDGILTVKNKAHDGNTEFYMRGIVPDNTTDINVSMKHGLFVAEFIIEKDNDININYSE